MNEINVTLKSIKPIKDYIYNYIIPLLGFNSSFKILKGFYHRYLVFATLIIYSLSLDLQNKIL